MALWTAFTLGFLGSLHCVGMCGPIALALPQQEDNKGQILLNSLLYNGGRIFTYIIIGSLVGFIGQGLILAGVQRWFTLGLGILFFFVAIFSINFEKKINALPFFQRFYFQIKLRLSKLLKNRKRSTLFGIGVLNGLIPCGLVWLAVVGAFSAPSILESILYMGFFGLGTLPLMTLVSLAGSWTGVRFRTTIRKLTPVFLFLFSLLFIFRGLNFQFPEQLNWMEAILYVPMCH